MVSFCHVLFHSIEHIMTCITSHSINHIVIWVIDFVIFYSILCHAFLYSINHIITWVTNFVNFNPILLSIVHTFNHIPNCNYISKVIFYAMLFLLINHMVTCGTKFLTLYSIEGNNPMTLEFWNMKIGKTFNLKMVTTFLKFFNKTNISHDNWKEKKLNMKKLNYSNG
jgi:hypothetical protein